jgi:hypothetical protein
MRLRLRVREVRRFERFEGSKRFEGSVRFERSDICELVGSRVEPSNLPNLSNLPPYRRDEVDTPGALGAAGAAMDLVTA